MASISVRFSLSFSLIVRIIVFLPLVDGVAGDERNLALGKTARQITTQDASPASAAVDGNDTTASCTQDNEGHPWWAVDLGERYIINHVIITSKTRLTDFEVGLAVVFPTEGTLVSVKTYARCGQYRRGAAIKSRKIVVSCAPSSGQFRYVIVRGSDETPGRLCIAEVAVFGKPGNVTQSPTTQPVGLVTSAPGGATDQEITTGSSEQSNQLLLTVVGLSVIVGITFTVIARRTSLIGKKLLGGIWLKVRRSVDRR